MARLPLDPCALHRDRRRPAPTRARSFRWRERNGAAGCQRLQWRMPSTIDPGRQDAFVAARSQLRSALETGGPRRALEYLSSRTPHRFTAMYRFDDATLRNLVFYDADHPDAEHPDDIPVLASYCV